MPSALAVSKIRPQFSIDLRSPSKSLGFGGSPSAIRSCQVAHAEAVLAQNACRVVGTLAVLAIRDDFAITRQLTQAQAQLIQGNMRQTGNEPSLQLSPSAFLPALLRRQWEPRIGSRSKGLGAFPTNRMRSPGCTSLLALDGLRFVHDRKFQTGSPFGPSGIVPSDIRIPQQALQYKVGLAGLMSCTAVHDDHRIF